MGHGSGQRAALSLELPLLSALRRALPAARPPGRVRRRSAPADHHPERGELQPLPRHGLSADPRRDGRSAHRPAGRDVPSRLELRDVPRHRERGHHAELHRAVRRHGARQRVVCAAHGGPRRRGRGTVLARLADGMAADVPHPARPAGRPVALRGTAGAAARLDRALPRRHARHGVRRRLGLAGPRGRRRPARPPVDGQGRALGLGGLHLAQGRLSVGRHGGLPAGRGRRRHSRHPGLGHLALHLDGLDGSGGGGGPADAVAQPARSARAGACLPSSASPSWPVSSSTSIRSRRIRRCRSTSWPG